MSVNEVVFQNNTLELTVPPFVTVQLSGPAGVINVPPLGSSQSPVSATIGKIIGTTANNLEKEYLYTGPPVTFGSSLAITVVGPDSKHTILVSDSINSASFIYSPFVPTPEKGSVLLNQNLTNGNIVKYTTLTFSGPAGKLNVVPIGTDGPFSAVVDTLLGETKDGLKDKYIFQKNKIAFGEGLHITLTGPNGRNQITLNDGINTVVFVKSEDDAHQ